MLFGGGGLAERLRLVVPAEVADDLRHMRLAPMRSPQPSPGMRLRAEMWRRGFLRVQTLPGHRPNLLNREPVPPASRCKPGSTSHAAGSCLLHVLPAFAHEPPLQSPPLPSLRPDGPRPTRASGCMVPSYFPRSAWPEICLRHIHGLP